MEQSTLSQIAGDLLEARANAAPVDRPSSKLSITLDDGYAIAAEVLRRRLDAGDRIAGAKLGVTNTGLWPSMGLSGPLWAPVFASTYTEDARVELPRLRAPEAEPEVVFGLRAGIDAGIADITSAIEWIALGFEIIDSRYPPGSLVAADQVADHCSHIKLIVGPKRPFEGIARDELGSFTSEVLRDGAHVQSGGGNFVMGNPLVALEWFAHNLLGRIPWPQSTSGVLTSGRLGAPPRVPPGTSRWELRASIPLPPLSVTIVRPE